ncbi:MAG: lipid A biosynthesis acyltransferase [Betaproteobacteria bacterium]|nr:lipid A biosynthesis acyltransferase [Betaproteobacteria bacterium]
MGTRLGLAILWLLHFLPLRALEALARVLAAVAVRTRFARTTLINLHACFPEWTAAQRLRLARRHLAALIRSVLELGILWWSPKSRIEQLVRFKHLEHAEAGGRPVIFLTPHLVGLEMQGARMGMKFRGVGFFTPHKNRLIDRHIREARDRLGDVVMLERKKGLRPLIRAIQDGRRLYFLPDMDFGDRDSIFSPFFGIPAATVPTLPWLARMTGAVVIPCICRQLPHCQGYEVEFFPAWDHFPSEDLDADVRRMNAFIESQARRFPEQYFWSHKRFRTRPDPAEPYFYRWPQSLD